MILQDEATLEQIGLLKQIAIEAARIGRHKLYRKLMGVVETLEGLSEKELILIEEIVDNIQIKRDDL